MKRIIRSIIKKGQKQGSRKHRSGKQRNRKQCSRKQRSGKKRNREQCSRKQRSGKKRSKSINDGVKLSETAKKYLAKSKMVADKTVVEVDKTKSCSDCKRVGCDKCQPDWKTKLLYEDEKDISGGMVESKESKEKKAIIKETLADGGCMLSSIFRSLVYHKRYNDFVTKLQNHLDMKIQFFNLINEKDTQNNRNFFEPKKLFENLAEIDFMQSFREKVLLKQIVNKKRLFPLERLKECWQQLTKTEGDPLQRMILASDGNFDEEVVKYWETSYTKELLKTDTYLGHYELDIIKKLCKDIGYEVKVFAEYMKQPQPQQEDFEGNSIVLYYNGVNHYQYYVYDY
jgi:hypothetical protein